MRSEILQSKRYHLIRTHTHRAGALAGRRSVLCDGRRDNLMQLICDGATPLGTARLLPGATQLRPGAARRHPTAPGSCPTAARRRPTAARHRPGAARLRPDCCPTVARLWPDTARRLRLHRRPSTSRRRRQRNILFSTWLELIFDETGKIIVDLRGFSAADHSNRGQTYRNLSTYQSKGNIEMRSPKLIKILFD